MTFTERRATSRLNAKTEPAITSNGRCLHCTEWRAVFNVAYLCRLSCRNTADTQGEHLIWHLKSDEKQGTKEEPKSAKRTESSGCRQQARQMMYIHTVICTNMVRNAVMASAGSNQRRHLKCICSQELQEQERERYPVSISLKSMCILCLTSVAR